MCGRNRKLHELIRSHDHQHNAHWNREPPSRGVVHDGRRGKLIFVPASLEFAAASREHVLHPFGVTAVGQRNDEAIVRFEDIHGRPVDLPRFAPT